MPWLWVAKSMDYEQAIRRVADEIERIQTEYGCDACSPLAEPA